MRKRKFARITPTLPDDLHWLPVQERIVFNLCVIIFKCRHQTAPQYLQELCVSVTASRPTSRRHLAANAWWGFTTAADRQRLDAVIRRGKRSCLCSSDLPSLAELIDKSDDDFFSNILSNPHHVLHSTLPKETASSYALRRRRHNRELLDKSSRLVQSCFVVRMLYKDIY